MPQSNFPSHLFFLERRNIFKLKRDWFLPRVDSISSLFSPDHSIGDDRNFFFNLIPLSRYLGLKPLRNLFFQVFHILFVVLVFQIFFKRILNFIAFILVVFNTDFTIFMTAISLIDISEVVPVIKFIIFHAFLCLRDLDCFFNWITYFAFERIRHLGATNPWVSWIRFVMLRKVIKILKIEFYFFLWLS